MVIVRKNAFTLIESIAILLIIAIVAAVAVSSFSSPSLYNLRSRTETIKDHLRFAQNRAMNTSIVYGINFSGNSYFFFSGENPQNPLLLPGQDETIVILPSGMTISPTGIVSFDSWGKPYTDAQANTPQVGIRTFTVTYGGDTEVITITANTGFIP